MLNPILVKWLSVGAVVLAAFFAGIQYEVRSNLKTQVAAKEQQVINFKKAVSTEILASQEKNNEVVAKIRMENNEQLLIKQQILDRLQKQLKGTTTHVIPGNDLSTATEESLRCPLDLDYRFDVATVGLFNAASSGLPAPDTASGTDEKGRAPSDVGITDFASYNLEVIRMYRELATRHDGLVDYVEQKQKDQK